jgi:hypothetical protein
VPSRLRLAPLCGSLVVAVVALASCDSAFHGGTTVGGAVPRLAFSFGDGTQEADVVQGDPVGLRVTLPRVGYARVVATPSLVVDPSRLVLVCDRPLGDPQAGGFAPGVNLSTFAADQGWLTAFDGGGATLEARFDMDSDTPLLFPTGLLRFTLFVEDDADRISAPFVVELTLISPERPTLVMRLERPPADRITTGLSLPLGLDGLPFVGEQLPLALVIEGIPNPASAARFTRLIGANGIDPARLVVSADHDLGDPQNGGVAAGENLASRFAIDLDFVVDPDTGGFTTGLLFHDDDLLSPALGTTTFSGTVLDDGDVLSDPQTATLEVESRVTLSLHVQPILSANCGFECHDGQFPILDQDLSTGHTYASTVGVRAAETPDDSCATLRIDPYDTDASYLFHKVSGTHLGGCVNGSGDSMPPGLPLGSSDLAVIQEWILQGAPDD